MGIKLSENALTRQVSIAPLVVFRIAFGVLMFASTLRFILKGWVDQLYIDPKIFFPYYGFEWVKPLGANGMYIVFALLLLTSLFITIGFLYRYAAAAFFLLFTYVELIDKTNYLNHYYFISIVSFLLILVPANRHFSLDVRFRPSLYRTHVPAYFVWTIKLQLLLVYVFAGIAKINSEWLLEAMPLKLWLPAFSHVPFIGTLLEQEWVAYVFCWFGCIYDLFIGVLLINRKTVRLGYFLVVIFHALTAMFFNIGMFPYIMITLTTIFFTDRFHERIIAFLRGFSKSDAHHLLPVEHRSGITARRLLPGLLFVHFTIQIVLPFRYVLYPGKLFWTEQGYRWSWRVMLMEKAGTAFFYVRDGKTGRETEVMNSMYLTPMQEKMVATQPDMLVDYAHFLKEEYQRLGFENPEVRTECYVTLNGRGSTLIADPETDLSSQTNNPFHLKTWILPYAQK
jgi:hypothetical protein